MRFGSVVYGGCLAQMVALSIVCAPLPARAVEGGYSNYMPGAYGDFQVAMPPAVGLTYTTYLYLFQANGEQAVRGQRVEQGVQLFNAQLTPYLVFAPKRQFLKAQAAFGLGFTVEYVGSTNDGVEGARSVRSHSVGFGDIYLSPFSLTWTPGSSLFINVYQGITAPVGRYDPTSSVNVTLNYWSFDNNVAFTYLNPAVGVELSTNLGYIYNTVNRATNYHSGQELHLSYMVNYYFDPPVAIGVQGSYYRQITPDHGSGALLGPNRAELAGIGPAIRWEPVIRQRPVFLVAKWQYEVHARNRLRGNDVWLYFGLSWDVYR